MSPHPTDQICSSDPIYVLSCLTKICISCLDCKCLYQTLNVPLLQERMDVVDSLVGRWVCRDTKPHGPHLLSRGSIGLLMDASPWQICNICKSHWEAWSHSSFQAVQGESFQSGVLVRVGRNQPLSSRALISPSGFVESFLVRKLMSICFSAFFAKELVSQVIILQ